MPNDESANDAIQKAQIGSLIQELMVRLVEGARTVEPRLSSAREVATAYLMAAIVLDLQAGVPKAEVTRIIRNLADSVERGHFDWAPPR